MAKTKVKLIRVSEEIHERMNTLRGELTYTEFVAQVIRVHEAMQTCAQIYCSNGKFFTDLSDARGESILESVRTKTLPTLPTIYACIGEDDALLK